MIIIIIIILVFAVLGEGGSPWTMKNSSKTNQNTNHVYCPWIYIIINIISMFKHLGSCYTGLFR
jgi:flagellar basal body-associated protein FliL